MIRFFYGYDYTSKTVTMYILSLPLFRWFKKSLPNYPRRKWMKGSSANNNQAIFSGGLDPLSTAPFNMTDEWDNNLAIMNLTDFTFKFDYDSNAPAYTAPDIVRRAYENP
jgi:hypothetical protein